MKRKKLLHKLQVLLSEDDDHKKKDIDKLRKVIKQLHDKQKELEHKLEELPEGEEQSKVRKHIEVIRLQRQKGAAVYRELMGKDELKI